MQSDAVQPQATDVSLRADALIDMHELAPYPERPWLATVSTSESHVRLTWENGDEGSYPLIWLRDHCACERCRHPQTRERLVMPLEETPRLSGARVVQGQLQLSWQDEHISRFASGWLHQRRPGYSSPSPLPNTVAWPHGFAAERVRHSDLVAGGEGEQRWLTALLRDGLVLLDDGPLALDEVSRLAQRIGPLRATNFGARFDVVSKPNPNNAAYTAIGLALHTDLPNWRQPPDIQLLYCLKNDAEGGGSIFADGVQVAEALRAEHPAHFTLLATTPIDFRFQDDEQDIGVREPVIDVAPDGRIREIRFNNWIRDTLHLPEALIAPWYEAYAHFWALLNAPEHRISLELKPGQMVAFDNRRVLHGREAFDPSTGERHLQGTYLDRDMLESRLRVLARQG
ncbi:TauD/TfdA family dioxygenase [Halomonas denitrificans]|uniref:TauD/TfdA family dioxygenase n=1 Tax=Halomonas denitrificans TaxID=370769 RepID=UPI001C9A1901|nr:TauD/TfdA family dioxygenase [Halomonas denitrificans]MBY5967430.1 TauD/TfdA family dioxygenase [Halomonas denitrificans]